jgi:hypothetical protein
MKTWAGASSTNGVAVDQNALFDVVTVVAAPPSGLTLAVSKDTADTTNNALAMTPG